MVQGAEVQLVSSQMLAAGPTAGGTAGDCARQNCARREVGSARAMEDATGTTE
jgi:hypothetical protein